MNKKFLFIVAAVTCIIGSAGATQVQAGDVRSLDRLLAGTERCEESEALLLLRSGLSKLYPGHEGSYTGPWSANSHDLLRLKALGRLPTTPGAVGIKYLNGWLIFDVAISGSYKGLPVRKVSLWQGVNTGIYGWSVTFNTAREEVVGAFGSAIEEAARVNREVSELEGIDIGSPIAILDDEPTIYCDWSN